MNCDATRDLLPLFDDGDLPPDRVAAVADHLTSCAACCSELRALRELAAHIRRHGTASAGVAPARRARILAAARRPDPLRWALPRLLAAGLGALLVGAGWLLSRGLAADAAPGAPLAQYLDTAVADRPAGQLADLRRLEASPAGRFLAMTRTPTRGAPK